MIDSTLGGRYPLQAWVVIPFLVLQIPYAILCSVFGWWHFAQENSDFIFDYGEYPYDQSALMTQQACTILAAVLPSFILSLASWEARQYYRAQLSVRHYLTVRGIALGFWLLTAIFGSIVRWGLFYDNLGFVIFGVGEFIYATVLFFQDRRAYRRAGNLPSISKPTTTVTLPTQTAPSLPAFPQRGNSNNLSIGTTYTSGEYHSLPILPPSPVPQAKAPSPPPKERRFSATSSFYSRPATAVYHYGYTNLDHHPDLEVDPVPAIPQGFQGYEKEATPPYPLGQGQNTTSTFQNTKTARPPTWEHPAVIGRARGSNDQESVYEVV